MALLAGLGAAEGRRSCVLILAAAVLAAVITACSVGADVGSPTAGTPTVKGQTEMARSPAASSTPAPGELDPQLIEAAWNNDVPRARELIAAGADVNHQDDTQQSAYLIATSEGYRELLELTFRHGADVTSLDSYNGTGLIRAAERGHADIVGRLLQTDIDVDHVNNLGYTALHEAIVLGEGTQSYEDTVRLLVAGGANAELPPKRDDIAPVEHARSRQYDVIAATLESALDDQRTPADPGAELLRTAAAGDADQVALALRAGGEIEARDAEGRTPLLLAAANDQLAVARLLVALGADPDALDDRHDTPWLVTGVTGSVSMLEVLLPGEPDLTIRNRFGGISVIPASERGHVDYVRRVVQTDMDVNHVNDLGWTALLEAVILGDGSKPYQQIVRVLLDAGADPTIADRDGVTAGEHARDKGQDDVARILERSRG